MTGFAGRVSIVTGGTRGIGAAITERLVGEGAHVAAVYASNTDAADALVARLAGAPGSVSLHRADIGSAAACRDVVATVVGAHGRVDHLVNNAGLLVENRARAMTLEEWEAAIRVNLSAPFYLAQAVLGPMLEQGFGRIVNIGSVTALMGSPVEAGYGAAKAGRFGLSRSLAREVARKGITVNTVVPGVFETDMTNAMDPGAQEAIRRMIPLGRRGDPAELAHAVMFLLDERAAYLTGSVVTVDGGLSMGG
jgi:NAD(P)-dependent dehydrogenase (short-subunit alcohol dehydrogenase family)